MGLSQEEVVERLCKLSTEVASSAKFHWMHASDCFCRARENIPSDSYYSRFQYDEVILTFIEDAVRKEVAKCI